MGHLLSEKIVVGANFSLFGLGWNVSNEDFFIEHVPYIQWLKLKASYGVSGNMGFSPENAMTVYSLNTQVNYFVSFSVLI